MDMSVADTHRKLTDDLVGCIEQVVGRLERIESALVALTQQRPAKDWYGTQELAEILGKAEFTVREWCRLGRVRAQKRACGRGRTREWMVSHAELVRLQGEGLLPVPGT